MRSDIVIIGGGLAGSEAAWQAATRGAKVTLHEMRPKEMTQAHKTGGLAELVCSNSLGSSDLEHAPGILKEEMRRLGSLIIASAERARVPAGSALAVDRDAFSQAVTERLRAHPRITINGEDAGGFIGKPLRLEATRHLKPGPNTIRIEPFAPQSLRLIVLQPP